MKAVEILPYSPAYLPDFERLNKHWIRKYFILEPVDVEVLEKADQYIVNTGGTIIFAAVGSDIAGTVALKKIDDETVEMSKMAVDEAYQGNKIGWKLAEHIIKLAWEMGFKKVILYSNTKLVPAINMYQRLGFREIPLEPDRYLRSTIKMELLRDEQNVHYAIADELLKIVTEIFPVLQKIPEAVAAERSTRGKWSPKEIIGHLIDSGINNNTRFIRIQQISLQEIPTYDQNFWVKGQAWQHSGWQDLINLWAGFNQHLMLTIRTIPAIALQHQCSIGQREPVTLLFLVTDYVAHLKHHLKQIQDIIEDTI
ncbi:Ribosomal protein S18 acetylase RimI [Chitinophaga sp. CF118]|uniref:GNAT family N-acetyltransferase n=1 Tax=Chitinophaga sp. CF118 TaxID=1884367 RepID=UPI0008EA8592|nr:GNAT family N-acetyltransferase [Chitinophaga sp. CF118]SFF03458.1 Ribosomal protein S18 acetylase RimI [Chitinophaga sp. CF118]